MEKDEATEKKPYETPKLIAHGDVEKITLGNGSGDRLDWAFIGYRETLENDFS